MIIHRRAFAQEEAKRLSKPQSGDVYEWLISLLEDAGARYRIIEHPPEGRTVIVSGYRGHPAAQAAKCVVVMVKVAKHDRRYFLAVVPGDRLVDLQALRTLADGKYVAFASREEAESLSRTRSGTILPLSVHPGLELVADPDLLKQPVIFFNAARLDRSVALDVADYVRIAQPRIYPITGYAPKAGPSS
jgi:Ala-tRNA(Pro) deacylase